MLSIPSAALWERQRGVYVSTQRLVKDFPTPEKESIALPAIEYYVDPVDVK